MNDVVLCKPEEIATLLQSGDMEALDRVTRCYGNRLLSAARRYCRSEEEAHDAVQDATLNAWKYGPGFRGEGRVDRWLVRLVATACNRMRRGLKNDPKLHLADTEIEDAEESPELFAARAELAKVLAEVLNELKPEDRAMVILSDAQGWKGPEIAEALGMTPVAVRSRLSRAHKKLRAALEEVRPDAYPGMG